MTRLARAAVGARLQGTPATRASDNRGVAREAAARDLAKTANTLGAPPSPGISHPVRASQRSTRRLSFLTIMPDPCAYPPCQCLAPNDEIFCGDTCAMLGAGLVNQ